MRSPFLSLKPVTVFLVLAGVCSAGVGEPPVADPQTAGDFSRLAWWFYRVPVDDEAALRHAERALGIDPQHYKANELAGLLQQRKGNHAAAFAHWLRLLGHDRPETAFYLRRLYGLNLNDNQRAAYIRAVEKVAGDMKRPVLGAAATWFLAGACLDAGKVDHAKRLYSEFGLIKNWRMIGPFNNERNSGFNRVFPPETEIDLEAEYEGRSHKVRWQELKHYSLNGTADLASVLYPNTNVLAYLLMYVTVPQEAEVVLRLSAEKSVKAWVNDQLLLADDQPHGFAPDRHEIPVVLAPGANKILLKVCADNSQWRFALRITDPTGRVPSGLAISTVPQATPNRAGKPKPDFPFARTMLGHFAQCVAAEPNSEDALNYLARAADDHGDYQLAAKTLEQLIEVNPKPYGYHLRLAYAYWSDQKPEKALVEIKAALANRPDSVPGLAFLGRFYESRGLLGKARETLERALKLRPDSLMLHDFLRRVYQAEGWGHQTYQAAKRNYQAAPEVPWVISAYARAAERRGYAEEAERMHREVLKRGFDDYAARNAIALLYRTRGEEDRAEAELQRLQELYPLRNDLRLRRARYLEQARKFDAALACCREALAICPTDPKIHREFGDIYERMDRMDDAIAAWKTALEYDPDDQELREYVDFLSPTENPVFAKYGISEEEAAGIRARQVKAADYPKAPAAVLLDHLVTQLFEDGSSTSLEHMIIQILNEKGRSHYTEVPITSRNAIVRRAVVIAPDGTETEATKVTDTRIHFDKIQPDSLIEYEVVHYQSPSSWLGRHYTMRFLFQGPHPMKHSQWILVYPKSKTVRHHLSGESVRMETGEFQGQNVLRFTAEDCPQIEDESNRPPLADIVHHVRVSTIDSWDEIARWENALIKDQFKADSKLTRQVRDLTKECKTREEKIRKLATFVAQNIQYKVLHGGIFGIKPHKAANVLENQWGDCKDKATLLITMLREVGIAAHYVTLCSRDSGTFIREIPYNQCNHAIVYVPDEGNFRTGRWIDGTAEYYSVDRLPWPDQGVSAMVFKDDGQIEFFDTPVDTPQQNVRDSALTVALDMDGNAKVLTDWQIQGQEAAVFRQTFYQEGKRAEILTAYINGLSPGSRLLDSSFNDITDREIPVRIKTTFEAMRFAQKEGNKLIVQPKQLFRMTARYTARDIRYYDVFLRYPNTVRCRETYRIPEGFRVASLPSAAEMEAPWMRYQLQWTQAGGTVTVEKTLTTKAILIPKKNYDDLRKFCYEVDQHERKTLELLPAAGGADAR